MYKLTVDNAIAYARRAIDEVISSESYGLIGEADTLDLHKLVEGFMVEAAVKTHSQAPAVLMEGKEAAKGTDYDLDLEDGVVTIVMKSPTLRIVSLRCVDSKIVLTEIIPEDSAEGRKQLDQYVRGVADDPRLVLQKKWKGVNLPVYKYYTTDVTEKLKIDFDMEIIPYPALKDGGVEISPRLEYAVLNTIVAMVLDSYREQDKAELYRGKAKEYMGG